MDAIPFLGFLFSGGTLEMIRANPISIILVGFWVWMFSDAIRREEWIWAIFVALFVLSAILYFFLVYRPNRALSASPTFELPGAGNRKRIRELEDQIHHLDKAHHHAELGEIYLQQGKLDKACECLEAARERDSEDLDIKALQGKCYLEMLRFEEAGKMLADVVAEDPRHDYGQTQMALGEVYSQLGEKEKAIAAWKSVLEGNTYVQAHVLLGQAYLDVGQKDLAREQFEEVLGDAEHSPAFQQRKDRYWIRRARQLRPKCDE